MKFIMKYYMEVNILSGLICLQTACKCYQQTAHRRYICKELNAPGHDIIGTNPKPALLSSADILRLPRLLTIWTEKRLPLGAVCSGFILFASMNKINSYVHLNVKSRRHSQDKKMHAVFGIRVKPIFNTHA